MATIYNYLDKKREENPSYKYLSYGSLYEQLKGSDPTLPQWQEHENDLINQSILLRAKGEGERYKGEMTAEELEERGLEQFQGRLLKNEISNYIETDDDYIKIKQTIVVQQEKINYLDSIIKQLNNRGFQIKNALDWLKFSRGT